MDSEALAMSEVIDEIVEKHRQGVIANINDSYMLTLILQRAVLDGWAACQVALINSVGEEPTRFN